MLVLRSVGNSCKNQCVADVREQVRQLPPREVARREPGAQRAQLPHLLPGLLTSVGQEVLDLLVRIYIGTADGMSGAHLCRYSF